ncbi:hypothetical protein AVEN_260840-1 [Araneus ventricosus]|uniref:Uncharacterized protein n=1 Tax=Araneus ventricosus TaxID=182803 RepID=A0A4Y2M1B4_ARAVE|nr:hypothetical protein AVEN_260840-1 [Araneus ventricosus]
MFLDGQSTCRRLSHSGFAPQRRSLRHRRTEISLTVWHVLQFRCFLYSSSALAYRTLVSRLTRASVLLFVIFFFGTGVQELVSRCDACFSSAVSYILPRHWRTELWSHGMTRASVPLVLIFRGR